MNGPDHFPFHATLCAELLATPAVAGYANDPNRALFASLIAGQSAGTGCLPLHLGLRGENYPTLLADYFPLFEVTGPNHPVEAIPEWDDLQKLLLDHRANERDSECWMADIVATACAGREHLWQDLGLANRAELNRLMWINFPELARSNTGDMKWKKFLYRQLCSREGIYVCPAPSCGECEDHAKCFGPEN